MGGEIGWREGGECWDWGGKEVLENWIGFGLMNLLIASCLAAQSSATQTSFQVLTSQDANFDYFCDS